MSPEIADIAGSILSLSEQQYPRDFVKVGQQVPLFLPPCLHCGAIGGGSLPAPCISCGTWLRRVVVPPRWALRGQWRFNLWQGLVRFRYQFLGRFEQVINMVLQVQGGHPPA